MRMSNKPTRGTPLSAEEKAAGDRLRPNWWGGIRFVKMPAYGKGSGGNGRRPNRSERGRSDWGGRR
jgi:hypothetical protein